MDSVQRTRWDVRGLQGVDLEHSYLVTSNHQSWVDILVLQYQLNRRAPFLKFFLKCNQNCLKNAGNPRDMRRFQVKYYLKSYP